MKIGEKIRELRVQKQMTQDELARKAGYVGKSMISRIENGKNNPSYDAIENIAGALNVNVSRLLDYECISLEDQEFLKSLGPLKPAEKLPDDIQAINVLLYECGEQITRVDGEYYLGECGLLSADDIAYLKESAVTSVKVAVEMLRKKAKKELKESLNRMDRR